MVDEGGGGQGGRRKEDVGRMLRKRDEEDGAGRVDEEG